LSDSWGSRSGRPGSDGGPFAGRHAILTTKHGKAAQIAPVMAAVLGLAIAPFEFDTDRLGTFSGEIPRRLPPLECAIEKARGGMTARGADLGLASEGTFGPHPDAPWVTTDRELVVLVDDRLGHVFWEQATSVDIVAVTETVGADADPMALATRADLPRHAVIVQATPGAGGGAIGRDALVIKGIREPADLVAAIEKCRAASPIGEATVTTDFRAHLCPSRQEVIAAAAERLARRLARPCPGCNAPGWGLKDVRRGVPCATCGAEVALPRSEVDGCWRCDVEVERPVGDGTAEPGQCDRCNP
jgi:hypothetical protein